MKYCEFLSRNAIITFTQKDMPYFRQLMVFEIVHNVIVSQDLSYEGASQQDLSEVEEGYFILSKKLN